MEAASVPQSTGAAPAGDPFAALEDGSAADGFSQALAALMAAVGETAPPAKGVTSKPSAALGQGAGGATGAADAGAILPTTAKAAGPGAESGPAGHDVNIAPGSDVPAVDKAVLDRLLTGENTDASPEPASGVGADKPARKQGAAPAAANPPHADAAVIALSALALPIATTAQAAAAGARGDAGETPTGDAAAAGADRPAVASEAVTAAAGASPAATPSAPPLDPRLAPFVAREAGEADARAAPAAPAGSAAVQPAPSGGDAPPTLRAAAGPADGATPPPPPPATPPPATPPLATLSIPAALVSAVQSVQPPPQSPLAERRPAPSSVKPPSASAPTPAAAPQAPLQPTAPAVSALTAVAAATTPAGDDAGSSARGHDSAPAPDNGPMLPQTTIEPGLQANAAGAQAPPNVLGAASAAAALAGVDLTAQLAAQIGRKASAGSARFDFALEPQGLGRVDVTLKIDPSGQLSAALSFDNPGAASEAKGRASELQQALQQAGFDVSQGGLSFTSGGAGDRATGEQAGPRVYVAPALTPPADPVPSSLPSRALAMAAGGVDIII